MTGQHQDPLPSWLHLGRISTHQYRSVRCGGALHVTLPWSAAGSPEPINTHTYSGPFAKSEAPVLPSASHLSHLKQIGMTEGPGCSMDAVGRYGASTGVATGQRTTQWRDGHNQHSKKPFHQKRAMHRSGEHRASRPSGRHHLWLDCCTASTPHQSLSKRPTAPPFPTTVVHCYDTNTPWAEAGTNHWGPALHRATAQMRRVAQMESNRACRVLCAPKSVMRTALSRSSTRELQLAARRQHGYCRVVNRMFLSV